MRHRVVLLEPTAPAKPAPGQACNGCGVCCSWQPCPLGMLLSRRTTGRCAVLRWSARDSRYRCGTVDPDTPLHNAPRWRRALAAIARRWIAVGAGCDSDLDAQPPEHPG